MAPLESWLSKVRWAMSSANKAAPHPGSKKKKMKSRVVGILAFEVGSLMSKLLHMWRAVGEAGMARLQHETIHLDGVRKVVSDDDDFLLGLACAELVDALRSACDSVAALADRCADPSLREFRDAFLEFADAGHDRHRWAASSWNWKDMHKMEKQVASTKALRRAMEELAEAEHGLRRKLLPHLHHQDQAGCSLSVSASKMSVAAEQQQLIFSKKQEVKHLQQTSIWGCTFDAVVASMARAAFTILARIKIVFSSSSSPPPPPSSSSSSSSSSFSQEEEKEEEEHGHHHPPLYRSLTLSSAVHPSSSSSSMETEKKGRKSMSMDMMEQKGRKSMSMSMMEQKGRNIMNEQKSMLTPPPGTLGADALAPRYAALVISIERMARSPLMVGPGERDELYGMLTASVRAQLRQRLRSAVPAADPGLAGQWRAALAGILEWLAPMAHATMRWQAERSFFFFFSETLHQNHQRSRRNTDDATTTNVLLLETLHFADRDKVEAALAELLVGLNYVSRFDKEIHRHLLLNPHIIEAEGPMAVPMEQ